MAIRLPSNFVEFQDNGAIGAASVNGGIAHTFTLPQDTDNVIVKLVASTAGAGVSTVFQTSDDGGVTWYDVARTSIVSNTAGNTLAEFLSAPVITAGVNPIVKSTANVGSILGGAIGSAGASTLGSKTVSGLPILGQYGRVFTIVEAAVTGVTSVKTQVKINSQSATA